MPGYTLEPLSEKHAKPVMAIFNSFVREGFAAYPEEPLPNAFFERILDMVQDYPAFAAVSKEGEVLGFGFLHRWHPFSTFDRAAEVSYFIKPEHTGKGIGKAMLDMFVEEAKELGVDTLLASISSRNEGSIRFHIRNGFREAGCLKRVGRKLGKDFDVVWMQRMLG